MTKTTDRFIPAHQNPFAVRHVTQLEYLFDAGQWSVHLDRLSQLNFRAAIVGQQGSGKTTLLEQLRERLLLEFDRPAWHIFLPQQTTHHAEMLNEGLQHSVDGAILLVDGIERLTFWQRQSLFRSTKHRAGLVVNVHSPCRLPTWIHCRTSIQILSRMLDQLNIFDSAIRAAAVELFDLHRGNIRDVFRSLYDRYSTGIFVESQPVT